MCGVEVEVEGEGEGEAKVVRERVARGEGDCV